MAPAGFVSHPGLSALMSYMPEFPGNAPEPKGQVIRRLARQWVSIALPHAHPDRLLVEGPALQDGHGRLHTRRATGYLNSLGDLIQLKPVAAVDAAGVRDLACELGLDPHTELEFAFMQTNTLVVFGLHKGRNAVAHLALYADRDAHVLRGAQNLTCLSRAALNDVVPLLLQSGRLNGRAYTIQTRLPGAVYTPDWTRPKQLFTRIDAALAPLRELASGVQGTAAALPRGRSLARRFPPQARVFAQVEEALQTWRSKARCTTPVHGDYGFHNLLFGPTGALTGIVDWDRLRLAGDAHFDALHLVMNAAETAGVCMADEFLIGLWVPRLRNPRLEPVLRHVLYRTGCSEADARFTALAIWLALIDHGSTHVGMSAAWRKRLVDRPARGLLSAGWLYPSGNRSPGSSILEEAQRRGAADLLS